MPRYTIRNGAKIVNVVEWDGGSGWAPPAGFTATPFAAGDVVVPDVNSAATDQIRSQVQQAADTLRTYANLANPTAAQTTNASQLMARTMIRLIRLQLDQTDVDT